MENFQSTLDKLTRLIFDGKTYFVEFRDTEGKSHTFPVTAQLYLLLSPLLPQLDKDISEGYKELIQGLILAQKNIAVEKLNSWLEMEVSTLKKKLETEVNIYFPSQLTLRDKEAIVNACGDLMEALGFELKAEEEPVFNSFWQRLLFVFKKNVTTDEFDRVFRKGKQALEMQQVDLPTAEQTLKLAESAEKILALVDKYGIACIRLGALLVIKKSNDERPKIYQLNADVIDKLNREPEYIKNMAELERKLVELKPLDGEINIDIMITGEGNVEELK